MQGVYLLHFTPKLKHAGHYLGYADDIDRRIQEHRNGTSGAVLPMAAVRAGCDLQIARIWEGADRNKERKLKGGRMNKRVGSLARKCPICKAQRKSIDSPNKKQ